jgi:hypothetical protein
VTAALIPAAWSPSLQSGFARSASESANPRLWRGLQFAFNGNISPRGKVVFDIARGSTHFDVDAEYKANKHGLGLIGDASNNRIDIQGVDREISPNKAAGLFVQLSVAGTGGQGFIDLSDTTATNRGIWLGYEGAQVKCRASSSSGGDLTYFISNTLIDTAAATIDDYSDKHELWVNGISRATNTIATELSFAPYTNLRLCSLWSNVYPLNGILNCAYVWNRQIHHDEVRQLHEDSLAPFRLRSKQVFFAGVPTFTGTATPTIPMPTVTGAGTMTPPPTFTGSSSSTIPMPTVTGAGTITAPVYSGTATLTIPMPTATSAGTETGPVFSGTGALTAPMPFVHTTSGLSSGGNISIGTVTAIMPMPVLLGVGISFAPAFSPLARRAPTQRADLRRRAPPPESVARRVADEHAGESKPPR